MTDTEKNASKSKKIASNTVILFIRMLVLMLANLYGVRLLLQGLGDENYGIYNAISGFVTTTAFLSSVLALSLQRFYSVSLGLKDLSKGRDAFNASIRIILILMVIILVVFETAGVWFLTTKMSIPEMRQDAALLVFQFSLVTFLVSLIQVPFLAAIFAHEEMNVYSVISTVECLGRVFVAYLAAKTMYDGLVFYAFGYMAVGILVMGLYGFHAMRKYEECSFAQVQDSSLFKKLVSFSGWTTFGTLASTAMTQGGIILLNIYFGPLANAAFGVAMQINNAFNSLTNSLVIPFRPAMIKAYAEENRHYLNSLFEVNNKVIYYFLLAVGLPIISELDTILHIWLGSASEYMVLFSRLIVVYVIFFSIHNPITIVIHASGRIKMYHLLVEIFTLLCFPLTWVAFHFGAPAYGLLLIMILCCVLSHFVRIYCMAHSYAEFSVRNYITHFIIPAGIVTLLGIMAVLALHYNIEGMIQRLAVVVCVIPAVVVLLAYVIGISKEEKSVVNKIFKTKLLHR